MLRGGYMKNVANGIYSQYMPLRRITKKIEDIIRDEMDKIGGQEVLFPVALPASLWTSLADMRASAASFFASPTETMRAWCSA
mgnify:CR=1 FL=1